jgi:hypothetical protein
MTRLAPLAFALLLAGCGSRGELKPATGAALPVKPYGATATPQPSALLTPNAQARPARSDDLLKSSEPRTADPFDLPPNR